MRKIVLLLIALVASLLVTEVVCRMLICYPRYPYKERIYEFMGAKGHYRYFVWHPSYGKIWSVEGGNKSITLNNIGLPGSDIRQSPNSKYVLLLGNSFIRGLQYQGDKIAAGILQKRLTNTDYQVINAGNSGYDPYVLWFSANFFERYYEPSKVILVYETFSRLEKHMARHEAPLKFELPDGFGRQVYPSKIKYAYNHIRGYSSFVNLIGNLKSQEEAAVSQIDNSGNSEIDPESPVAVKTFGLLKDTLSMFANRYGDRFCFVSLMRDNPFKEQLSEFCLENKINYFEDQKITSPENLIEGKGHFNIEGNKLLADLLTYKVMGFVD